MQNPPPHDPNGVPHPGGNPTGGQGPYPQGPPPQGPPQGHPAGPYQPGPPPPPPGQPPYGHPQGGHPYGPGFPPHGQGQPPYGPGQPPYGPGQPPYGPVPPQGAGGGMSKGAKIALVGGAGVLVLVLVAGTVVALSLGQGSDETVASAADDEDRDEDDAQGDDDAGGENDGAPSAPSDGESEVFEGSGDELVELDPPHADPQILTVEGNGDGMVSVTVVSEDGDEVGHASSLRGEEGGTRTIYNHRGYDHEITGLDVRTSNDSWTLTIEPLDSLDPWTDPDEPLEGSGRDVVLIDWDTSGVELEMEHDGTSNFIVWGGNPDDGVTDLLANEIGEVDMGEQLSDGTTLLEIDADGDWTLTPA